MESAGAAAGSDPLAHAVAELRCGPQAPPGVVLGVSGPDGRRWAVDGVVQAFDDAGPSASVAIGPDTRCDLGSVTKVVATTTALMALVDAGGLRLDTRLGELLPRYDGRPAGAAEVAHLLGHRAGLWEWWPLYLHVARNPRAALDLATSLPLRYPPGTARHYSDLGFQLLGALVATAAGQPLDEAVHALVLGPWGLGATGWAHPAFGAPVAASSNGDAIEEEMIRTGVPYPVSGDADAFPGWRRRVLVGEVNDGNAFHAFGGVAGHAGLFSCAADLAHWAETLLAALGGGGPVAAETVRRFTAAGPDPAQGLGFRRWVTTAGGCRAEAIGHTGFPGVAVAVLPAHGSAAVLVTNRLHVRGRPRATDPMWELALDAAHRAMHD